MQSMKRIKSKLDFVKFLHMYTYDVHFELLATIAQTTPIHKITTTKSTND